jgi:[ribosomal protein S5]-alanine N-acetyltransferase
MSASHVDALFRVFADLRVMVLFGVPPFSRGQMEHWVQRNLAHQDDHGYGLFTVILKSSGMVIGDCGLEHMEINGTRRVEPGYDFRSDYWNKGYSTEAVTAVRDFAIDKLRIPQLISLIRVGNNASKRVAEKIGMRCDAEIIRNGAGYWQYSINSTSKES